MSEISSTNSFSSSALSSSSTFLTAETGSISSSSFSSCFNEGDEQRHILTVSKSKSERLLGKFFDALEFDFDYEQSSLWSPPLRRSVFLASPGIIICASAASDEDNVLLKLRRATKKKNKRKKISAHFGTYRRFFSCFTIFWCC